ncbi:medium chain dehydrogenase/reductase family protein (plasmid) [Haladaptatus sp. SPP-AMP-3]|uniref:medium chain dehydrogenase/reductase family protein n=1 Tax=Haladaptatus sp. SPP-AMP-3 TaxID=3121295 RepID=UPI003C2FD5B8
MTTETRKKTKTGTTAERTGEGDMAVTEIVMPRMGTPDVLTTRRRPLSSPNDDEAVVRVEAAGVSFAEVQMLRGRYFNQPKFPFVPGYDLVGRVTEVGADVTVIEPGQRVAALTETGAWSDHVVLPAGKLAPVPDELDPTAAVAVVTNGVTAWQMLHRVAEVKAGETVLVHGASGGVGTLLTRLARLADVRVIGTASAEKQDAVRELGAIPLEYRNDDVPARVRELARDGVDAVFDHVGGPGLTDSWRMLGSGGTLVSYGVAGTLDAKGHRLRPFVPIVARLLFWKLLPNGRDATFYYVDRWPKYFREDVTKLFDLLARGELDATIDEQFPLSRASEALEKLESGKVTGKVVLVPDGE